jgi:xanthine dehydrogenase YagR molybdenum-binding subunit
VDGDAVRVDVAADDALVDVLRDRLGRCATKLVCGAGVCGACTVLLDGDPVVACLLPATAADGRTVTTVAGVAAAGALHPVQAAFAACDGLQCGFCTPGFVVDAVALHDAWRREHPGGDAPTREHVAAALAGHLCRCGAYQAILDAVVAACAGEFDDADACPPPARVEAPEKVRGAATYTVDVRIPGMLHGVVVRSPWAHAHVRLDPLDAEAVDVVDLRSPDHVARYVGAPIAAVSAATAEEAAQRARAVLARVRADTRPFTLDPVRAVERGAPVVHRTRAERRRAPTSAENPLVPTRWHGNVRGPVGVMSWRRRAARRRIAAARARRDAGLVELDVTAAPQVHTPFEPHATVARWSADGSIDVWTSTQAVAHVADAIAERWSLDRTQVRVHAEHVGGGFGNKLGLATEAVAAIELARRSGAPVRVALERAEELVDGGARPGVRATVALVGDRDRLRAMTMSTWADGGVSVGSTVSAMARLVYGRSPRDLRDADVVTNAPPATPFRGPGGPSLAWALEQAVDQAAHQLDADPIDLRRRWDGNRRRQVLYERAAAHDLWLDRGRAGTAGGRHRRGVGVAAGNWFYFVDPHTEVEATVQGGRVHVRTASQDMGTGSRTVVAGVVAGVLDVPRDRVVVHLGTAGAPHGPTSGGSRTTASLAPAAAAAAERLRDDLARAGLALSDPRAEGRRARAGRPRDRRGYLSPFALDHLRVGRGMSGAVHLVEVEVDTALGHVRVLRVAGFLAVGHVYEPRLARSQCEGGVVQGVSYALYEERRLDPVSGRSITANLEDYRIAGIGDCPEIQIEFAEDGWEHVPGKGVGLGEISTLPVAAAVANAVFHATGWRPVDLPIRPDRVLTGLRGGAR